MAKDICLTDAYVQDIKYHINPNSISRMVPRSGKTVVFVDNSIPYIVKEKMKDIMVMIRQNKHL